MAKRSKESVLSVLLHGIFLVSLNLFAVMLSLVFVKIGLLGNEQIIHSIAALVLNIGIYIIVFRIMRGLSAELMVIRDVSAFIVVLCISLAFLPVIFFPIHYLAHGYLGNVSQLWQVWPYQLIVNGLCIVLNYFILSRRSF